jgi:hypothetical protein
MTSVLGLSMPKVGISKQESASPKQVALGGIALTSIVGGGVAGALKGSPLKGLAIGGAVAAVALGAALLGTASASQRDGWCDYYGDPDCDYPRTRYPHHDPYPRYDPAPRRYDPYPDPDYPSGGYPGRGTSWGDD